MLFFLFFVTKHNEDFDFFPTEYFLQPVEWAERENISSLILSLLFQDPFPLAKKTH